MLLTIDTNSTLDKLQSQTSSESHDSSFSGSVVQESSISLECIYGSGVNDGTTFLHMRQRMPVENINCKRVRLWQMLKLEIQINIVCLHYSSKLICTNVDVEQLMTNLMSC